MPTPPLLQNAPGSYLIDFDANATTRPDPQVVEAMLPFLREHYGNPSSGCRLGKIAANAVRQAREQVAGLIGCAPEEILFTSGGTEANNTVLHAVLAQISQGSASQSVRRHILTTAVEHPAMLRPCEAWQAHGYRLSLAGVDSEGQLLMSDIDREIKPETALISVMTANNETGVVFPIAEVARVARERGIFFHTDAVQAIGKIPLDFDLSQVHFMSMSAHKIHGPKGVGALYVNRQAAFSPLLLGGGQENRRRAGTENVAGIVGFGKAAELAAEALRRENAGTGGRESTQVAPSALACLRDHFERGVLERISGVRINGGNATRLPNTSSLTFEGVEAEGALLLLERARICASAGSACTSGSLQPSHVLRAMGRTLQEARGSLRFSFSRENKMSEVDHLLKILPDIIARLRAR